MKFVNPLHHPWAILAGGIVLVLGVRLAKVNHKIMLPAAGAIALGGSWGLSYQERRKNPGLGKEINLVKQQAELLVAKAGTLRQEAKQILTESSQMDLLVAIQYACDHVQELPLKLEQFSRRFLASDSLLSIKDLQEQLSAVEAKIPTSSGASRQNLRQLATSLESNLELAKQGEDARQAQVISLSTLITEAGGVLQRLQNKLRNANLTDDEQMAELEVLSQELGDVQESVDLLVR